MKDNRKDRRQLRRRGGDKMVVLFDDMGYKTLAVNIATEKGPLEPVQEE